MEFKNSDNTKIWLQCVRSSLNQLYPDCLKKSLEFGKSEFVQLFENQINPRSLFLTARVDLFAGLEAVLKKDFAKKDLFLRAFDEASKDCYINFGLSSEELEHFAAAQAVGYERAKMPTYD